MIYFVYSAFSCFIKICIFCLQNIMQIGFLVFRLFVRGERLFLENVACLPLIDIYFSRMCIHFLCIYSNINCVLDFFYYICSIDVRFLIVYGLYVKSIKSYKTCIDSGKMEAKPKKNIKTKISFTNYK